MKLPTAAALIVATSAALPRNAPKKSAFRPTDPTLIVGAPVSFLAQPAKFRPLSPSSSGNSGSQKRRCEQCRMSTPASTNGSSQSVIS